MAPPQVPVWPLVLPDRPVPDLIHGLTALLPGYTRSAVENMSTEVVASIEHVLHLLVPWAEVVNSAGRSPLALLRLAAQYAQLAARLRMQRGQSVVGVAWVAHGMRWAGVSADSVARATLLSDFCTLTRLDRDAASSLAYAKALGAVDPPHVAPLVRSEESPRDAERQESLTLTSIHVSVSISGNPRPADPHKESP